MTELKTKNILKAIHEGEQGGKGVIICCICFLIFFFLPYLITMMFVLMLYARSKPLHDWLENYSTDDEMNFAEGIEVIQIK